MNNIRQKILLSFTKHKNASLSTSHLVKEIFQAQFNSLNEKINNDLNDGDLKKLGKRELARLHRKLLYHINTLVEEDILIVSEIKGKGEKAYVVNTQKEPEDYKTKQLIETITGKEHESIELVGLEKYQEKGYIKKPKTNFIRKLKAVMLNPEAKSLTELFVLIEDLLITVTDVIAIQDFQNLISRNDPSHLQLFLRKLDYESQEYKRQLNLIIELKDTDQTKMTDFLEFLERTQINLIVLTNPEEIGNKKRLINKILSMNNVAIQNKDINHSPILLGTEGVYSVSRVQWDEYLENKQKIIGLLYSSTSITIDAEKYFSKSRSYTEFRQLILDIAKNIISATTHQRRNADTLFFKINYLNKENQNQFYSANTNYIRLKGIDKVAQQKEDILMLLESTSEMLKEFCITSETIFKSCGLPTRIRVKLGTIAPTKAEDIITNDLIKKINSHHSFSNIKDFQELIKTLIKTETALIEIKKSNNITLEQFI